MDRLSKLDFEKGEKNNMVPIKATLQTTKK
jgi:hypothetical protein